MTPLSWASISEQLRAIGVEVPVTAPQGSEPATRTDSVPPSQPEVPPVQQPARMDKPTADAPTAIIAAAKKAGVIFMERVTDGELIVEGLDHLAPDDCRTLQARRNDIRNELLPKDTSTASLDLLGELGVELVHIENEQRAAVEVQRICATSRTLGLDIETAPLPEFLPKAWPIVVTKDGRRSKLQAKMDTSPALDPFRAEIRLLQVAAEIERRTVVLVIDLRHVPLGSPALAPLWRCKMIGHNLSFDAKMLVANGVHIADENLVDTILMAGLVLRGVEDARREGSRRPSLPAIPLRVRATTNPDGAGHNWVKARYQASDYHALGDFLIGPRVEADDTGPARRMVYAKLTENQLLLRVDPSYLAGIKAAAVDEGKFEGWVNGSWEILSGDLFGDLWPSAKTYVTLPSFPAEVIPPSWRLDRCLDWGDSAPFSVLWFAESDGSPIVWNDRMFNFIRGDIVLFMEWFGQGRAPNTGLRLSTPQLRDGIIEREIEASLRYQDPISGKWRSRIYAGAADTMIFNLKPGAGGDASVGSIAEDFEELTTINGVRYSGITWLPADKSPGSRVQGWQAIRSRLNATVPNANGAREKTGLFVCEGVRSFFDYVIVLPRDLKNNKEDIPDKLNDHTADCIRYRLRHNTQPTVSFRRRWIA